MDSIKINEYRKKGDQRLICQFGFLNTRKHIRLSKDEETHLKKKKKNTQKFKESSVKIFDDLDRLGFLRHACRPPFEPIKVNEYRKKERLEADPSVWPF